MVAVVRRVVIPLLLVVVLTLLVAPVSAATWWNSQWNSTVAYTITAPQPNYQVLVNVSYWPGMNTSFTDVVFTASDNTTVLNSWIENKTTGAFAWVWVKTIDTNSIFMYYGNQTVTEKTTYANDGLNTFKFFDDFNTLNTTKWYASGYEKVFDDNKGWVYVGTSKPGYLASYQTFGQNTALRTWGRFLNVSSTSGQSEFGYFTSYNDHIIIKTYNAGDSYVQNYSSGTGNCCNGFTTVGTSEKLIEIKRSSAKPSSYVTANGGSLVTISADVDTLSTDGIRIASGYNNETYDYLFIRNYTLNEPNATVGKVGYVPMWTRLNATPDYEARYSAEVQKLNNLTYLFAGYNGNAMSDIWNTTGGDDTVWRQVTHTAPFSKSYAGSSVVFNGRVYYFTLNNGEWYTDDMVNWYQVSPTPGWMPRAYEISLVYNDSIYVIGGGTYNDTWMSHDGTNWTQLNSTANWLGRYAHAGWVWNNKMYIAGGYAGTGSAYGPQKDIWYSTDGQLWIGAGNFNANGPLVDGIYSIPAVVFDNKIWLVGNYNLSGTQLYTEWSSDGHTWNTNVSEYPARVWEQALLDNYRLQIFDGIWADYKNDSWQTRPSVAPPIASFTMTNQTATGCLKDPCTVGFWDTSTSNTVRTWSWKYTKLGGSPIEFSTDRNPTYTFVRGNYSISLTASNEFGSSTSVRDAWVNTTEPVFWTLMNATPAYSRRGYSTEVLKFNNMTYLFGGLNWESNIENKNVYNTTGGNDTVWRVANASAGFGEGNGNYAGAAVSFNGRMYYYAGYDATNAYYLNTTWYSDDGVIWTQAPNASWMARVYPTAFVYNDSVYITGGVGWSQWNKGQYEFLNDTWVSRDGINFTRLNGTANWLGRYAATSWIWNNRMYIGGGYTGAGPLYVENDTWYSTDGQLWIGAGSWPINNFGYSNAYPGTYGSAGLVFDNKMWMIGGWNSSAGFSNATYSSTDGVNWVLNQSQAEFPGRGYHRMLVDNYRMQMYEGTSYAGIVTLNDSWQSWPATSAPIADFTMTNQTASGCLGIGCTVGFYDTSTSNTVRTWSWKYSKNGGAPIEFSTTRNPTFAFTSGNYSISLTASNEFGSSTSVRDAWVNATIGYVGWSATPRYSVVPQAVTFTDASDPSASTWTWDINGDGVIDSTNQNFVYTYTSAGAYTINHSASDGISTLWDNRSQYIIVRNPITVGISANDTTPDVCTPVQFVSTSTGVNITDYIWAFGDGSSSSLQNPMHTYSSSGIYTVVHNITDSNGTLWNVSASRVNVGYISANWLPITVDFHVDGGVTTGDAPLLINFRDDTMDIGLACGDSVAWDWNFGDGSHSTSQNPSHTYSGGTYDVSLVVTTLHSGSGTSTKTAYITSIAGVGGHVQPYPNTGVILSYNIGQYDASNGTYLKYFFGNLSRGEFNLQGLAVALSLPMINIFGYWIFLIIWLTYLATVWIRSQDLTLPLVIGLITAGVWGVLIPAEAYLYVGVMFAICIAVILVKLVWS